MVGFPYSESLLETVAERNQPNNLYSGIKLVIVSKETFRSLFTPGRLNQFTVITQEGLSH